MSTDQLPDDGFGMLSGPPLGSSTTRWIIVQFLLIVVGVLVALGAQAWWQHHEDRQLEGIYLDALLDDIVEFEQRLKLALREERASGETAQAMLRSIQSEDPIPLDTIKAWMTQPHWPLWYAEARPVLGAITALHQSGDLRLVQDDETRIAISSYAKDMEAEKEEFGRWVELSIASATQLNDLGSQAVRIFPVGEEPDARAMRASVFVQEIRDRPELRAILVRLQHARWNRIFYLERMRKKTVELHRLLTRSTD